jgi:hypothetical protein
MGVVWPSHRWDFRKNWVSIQRVQCKEYVYIIGPLLVRSTHCIYCRYNVIKPHQSTTPSLLVVIHSNFWFNMAAYMFLRFLNFCMRVIRLSPSKLLGFQIPSKTYNVINPLQASLQNSMLTGYLLSQEHELSYNLRTKEENAKPPLPLQTQSVRLTKFSG